MARYSETKEISFGNARDKRVVLAGGAVTINQWSGGTWNPTGTTITDEAKAVTTRGLRLQFVVEAGGFVDIEEGAYE